MTFSAGLFCGVKPGWLRPPAVWCFGNHFHQYTPANQGFFQKVSKNAS